MLQIILSENIDIDFIFKAIRHSTLERQFDMK